MQARALLDNSLVEVHFVWVTEYCEGKFPIHIFPSLLPGSYQSRREPPILSSACLPASLLYLRPGVMMVLYS